MLAGGVLRRAGSGAPRAGRRPRPSRRAPAGPGSPARGSLPAGRREPHASRIVERSAGAVKVTVSRRLRAAGCPLRTWGCSDGFDGTGVDLRARPGVSLRSGAPGARGPDGDRSGRRDPARHPEAVVRVAEVGRQARAVSHRAPRLLMAPGAAARHAARALRRTRRGADRLRPVGVGGVPVAAPFVDDAGEIRQAEAVDRPLSHARRRGQRSRPVAEPAGRRLVAPRIAGALPAAPRGALPLRLGREAVEVAALAGQPLAVEDGLVPGHAHHGLLGIRVPGIGPERRGRCAAGLEERAELGVGDRRASQPEAVDPHGMRRPSVGQTAVPAHPEPPRRDLQDVHESAVILRGRAPC